MPLPALLREQSVGFLMMFVLFLLCGVLYNTLINDAIKVFQVGMQGSAARLLVMAYTVRVRILQDVALSLVSRPCNPP